MSWMHCLAKPESDRARISGHHPTLTAWSAFYFGFRLLLRVYFGWLSGYPVPGRSWPPTDRRRWTTSVFGDATKTWDPRIHLTAVRKAVFGPWLQHTFFCAVTNKKCKWGLGPWLALDCVRKNDLLKARDLGRYEHWPNSTLLSFHIGMTCYAICPLTNAMLYASGYYVRYVYVSLFFYWLLSQTVNVASSEALKVLTEMSWVFGRIGFAIPDDGVALKWLDTLWI